MRLTIPFAPDTKSIVSIKSMHAYTLIAMEKSEDICYISHLLSDNFSVKYVFNALFLILFSLQILFCDCLLN